MWGNLLRENMILKLLKNIWQVWKTCGKFIGKIIGTIISTVLYIIIITPVGIIITLFKDYLCIKNKPDTMWTSRKPKDLTLEDMRKQY